VSFNQFSLDARIQAGVQAVGFTQPTPIQQQAIPHILNGRDIMGIAQTGTGKTAAFALPILNHLTKGPLRQIRSLILAPTRELAEQIHQTFVELGSQTKIRSAAIYGGVSKQHQINTLKRGVEVVVACPGRLLDLHNEGQIDLSQVEILVLDEADRMCDMGFLPDVRRIFKLLPRQRQTLFFSATMPEDIRQLADEILHKPVPVQIGIIAPAKTVSHALYPVSNALKKALLLAMLERTATGRVLIFTRTKHRARHLARDLGKKGYRAAELQGNMSQNKRQAAIDGFRSGKHDILVATDVASRGIDVAEISHVINFDMPDTVDAYTHRIGRTGRAAETGAALTLATPEDGVMIRDIEKILGQKLAMQRVEAFDYGEFDPEQSLVTPRHHNGTAQRHGRGQNSPSNPRSWQSRRGR
jgi:ATP-dependent RNA helicase RhlE